MKRTTKKTLRDLLDTVNEFTGRPPYGPGALALDIYAPDQDVTHRYKVVELDESGYREFSDGTRMTAGECETWIRGYIHGVEDAQQTDDADDTGPMTAFDFMGEMYAAQADWREQDAARRQRKAEYSAAHGRQYDG